MGPWLTAAALNGMMAVAMGALAAHGLATALDARALGWVETAVRYQMWHALALLAVGLLAATPAPGRRSLRLAGAAFTAGLALFCGSLYLLALTGWRGFAWVTPAGGLAFLVGWGALTWHGVRRGRAAVAREGRE